ncbi:LysM peptidoglycan-binding domain-containing protein [Lysinibacillus xylanilyticus]|uniref:cell division suppressor protein YneA n=1 Tax=Lysinibacillus xylanilyticus TaxID=582475 RepID=UPI002B2467AE|nr:LysM peptidoglycan-binding domain-containing protein [Lysinibacillus xylanilyticus]MEB2302330.1 LysM peptidoglycan-binding domain-containing protein [Lysinibacillus xylanilyticus]
MNWFKKNPHITILLGACLLFTAYLFITDPGDVTYAEIEIEHGDSLWSLAEQYRGKMKSDEWIKLVKAENELSNVRIIAGNSLVIPVVGDDQPNSINSIEIARNVK